MNRKMLFLYSLCIILILGILVSSSTAKASRVAAILSTEENSFWAEVWQGVRYAAKENKMDLSEYTYPHTVPEELVKWIDTAIYARVDGIVMCGPSNVTDEIRSSMEKAKANGIRIITVDTDAPLRDAFFGIANEEAAELLAKEAANVAPLDARIAIIGIDAKSVTNYKRIAAFRDYITKQRPDIQFASINRGNTGGEDVEDIMSFLSENDDISLVFSAGPKYLNNVAVAVARLDVNRQFQLFGFYESAYNLENIASNIRTVLVHQNPYAMGEEAMEYMNLLLQGETHDQDVFLIPVTLENEGKKVDE